MPDGTTQRFIDAYGVLDLAKAMPESRRREAAAGFRAASRAIALEGARARFERLIPQLERAGLSPEEILAEAAKEAERIPTTETSARPCRSARG